MSFCGKFIKCRLLSKKKTKRRPKIGIWSKCGLKAVKHTIVSALIDVRLLIMSPTVRCARTGVVVVAVVVVVEVVVVVVMVVMVTTTVVTATSSIMA